MKVRLEQYELIGATNVGIQRNANSISQGHKLLYDADPENTWQIHAEGACGECAFAKGMNWYWDMSVNTFKKADVNGVHVRTRSKDFHELIIRRNESGIFALVKGIAPTYKIFGWFDSQHVRDEWLHNHGDKGLAYFVPMKELYPIETIPDKAAMERAARLVA